VNKNILKDATVLYVEDEKDIAEEIIYFLSSQVKELRTAEDGIFGLEEFNRGGIDIIITDIMMPRMDGLEMIRLIREQNGEIPIIITSAYNDTAFLEKAINMRVNGYVIKPLDLMLFYDTIKKNYEPIILRKNLRKTNKELKELNEHLEDRVREEIEKNRAKDRQMFCQAKLAQMGEMLSMIAHQWRQPLNTIAVNSTKLELKIMMEKYDRDFFYKEIKSTLNIVKHLSDTIEDFRNFFKTDKEKHQISYEVIIERALNIVGVSLQSDGIELKKELNCNRIFSTFQNELEHVLLNLIRNAQDALIDREIKNPIVTISTSCENNKNILEIKDNAGGIDEKIIDKIFEPYFSTKIQKDGTGLGLSMSQTIIEKHCNGKLTVSNNKDGAVFKIEISSSI